MAHVLGSFLEDSNLSCILLVPSNSRPNEALISVTEDLHIHHLSFLS
jgi:hypothetical protein